VLYFVNFAANIIQSLFFNEMIPSLQQRIEYFVRLGETLTQVCDHYYSTDKDSEQPANVQLIENAIQTSQHKNKWFSEENQYHMLASWSNLLSEESLKLWLDGYEIPENNDNPKVVAMILAGNIPLVGFHDVLCGIITGNRVKAKLSSDDQILLPAIWEAMKDGYPEVNAMLEFQDFTIKGFDAAIATGSNNSARYFHSYFSKYPHIIRKNRNSVAVLSGNESSEELRKLGEDIFSYFGLGCRNVTKLMLPEGFQINRIFEAIYDFNPIVNHNKYANNYDYHKALWMLNREDLLDNGFVLFRRSDALASPVGSVFYDFYSSKQELESYLNENGEAIQCIVGGEHIPFGEAQSPGLSDYADNIDTLEFLLQMNSKN